jgi:hypothetical protein
VVGGIQLTLIPQVELELIPKACIAPGTEECRIPLLALEWSPSIPQTLGLTLNL